jgi:hypothetical protein
MTAHSYPITDDLYLFRWPINQDGANPPTPAPPPNVHHVIVVDCSGSMANDLPHLRVALKAKIPSLLREGDTVTLIWFSGRGEIGVALEGETVSTLKDLARVNAAIDRCFRPIGLTGFREPLQEVERAIERLRGASPFPVSLFFMSDGMDNQWTGAQIFEVVDRLATIVTASAVVEYGDYADRAMLAAIASRLGGTLLCAESLDEYEPMLAASLGDPIQSTQKIQFSLPRVATTFDFAFGLQADGTIGTYDVHPSDPEMKAYATVGDATRELWFLGPPAPEWKIGPPSPQSGMRVVDLELVEGAQSAAYAAVSLFLTRARGDVVWPLLRKLGDVRFIRQYANCFGKQAHGILADQARLAAFDSGLRYLDGRDPSLVPPDDAFTIVDLLRLLEEDEGARILLDHPSFRYRRVTRARIDADESFSEKDKARIRALQVLMGQATKPDDVRALQAELAALMEKKQEALKFKETPASDGYAVHGIVYNEEQPNISLRVRKEGTVDLSKRIARDAGQIAGLDKIEPKFPTFLYRNYAIVAHGNVNVRHLPVRVGIDTSTRLGKETGLVLQSTQAGFPKGDRVTLVLDLSTLPILNRQMIRRTTLADAVDKAYRLTRLRAHAKIYKSVVSAAYPSERVQDGFVARYGTAAADWLVAQGITEISGFAPKRVQAESTDYILGKSLEVKIKGHSTLPPVDKLREKLSNKGKLNGPESMMGEAIDQIEAFQAANPKAQHRGWITAKEKMLIAQARALSFQISQIALTLIVGQVWFSDCKDLDDRTREIQVEGGRPITGTAELEEIQIKL